MIYVVQNSKFNNHMSMADMLSKKHPWMCIIIYFKSYAHLLIFSQNYDALGTGELQPPIFVQYSVPDI
jgi:hypothetical protein